MKICIYSDPHWSQFSSILRQRGTKYSKRLEILINSINWVENLAQENNCDRILCLGDFFDRNNLNAEELTALTEIKWSSIPKQFLVGNHEMSLDDSSIHSLNALEKIGEIIDDVKVENCGLYNLVYIPYIDEDNRKSLFETIKTNTIPNNIIFSHNDIKGIRYGAYVSTTGYSIEEIEQYSELYINGHLHNSSFVNDRETILNLGNLSGQNFTEDAFVYKHYVCILNTDTKELMFYENPFAVNFYKVDINIEQDLNKLNLINNLAVVSARVSENLLKQTKELLQAKDNVIAHKEVIKFNDVCEVSQTTNFEKVNHLDELVKFCRSQIGDSEILYQELEQLTKNI